MQHISSGRRASVRTKAIPIVCAWVEGGVLMSGTNGIPVNAGANKRLEQRHLARRHNIIAARAVIVINRDIRGFDSANSSAFGSNAAARRTAHVRPW
jgi:hypothetical protein